MKSRICCDSRVVAAQRQAVQPVDQIGAVVPLGGERQALADAAEARGHLRRIEWSLLGFVEKFLESLPFRGMACLERRLLHLPAR
jgi:hypothetical protein